MELEEKIKLIKSFEIFESLTDEEAVVIAQATIEKTIPENTVFIEEETQADLAYLVVAGTGRVFRTTEDGEEITLSFVEPGDLIGEMSLIEDSTRSASIKSLQEMKVLTITKESFLKIIKEDPDIAIKILQSFSKRIRKADEKLEEIMVKNLKERVWKALRILGKYFPNGKITLTQEELAPIIGASRPRITEALHNLVKENKITLNHRKITLV